MRVGQDGSRWLDYYEVCACLKVTRERARQLRDRFRHQLIEGAGLLGAREMLFLESDILDYKVNRKSGRPKSSPAGPRTLEPAEPSAATVARLQLEVKLANEKIGNLSAELAEVRVRLAALESQFKGAFIVRVPRKKDPRS